MNNEKLNIENFFSENPQNRIPNPEIEMQNSTIIIDHEKTMPLYIISIPYKCLGKDCQFMATILHTKKDNLLESRGRLKIDATGQKAPFISPEKLTYSPTTLEKMKEELRNLTKTLSNSGLFKATKPCFEINFKINESMESVMKKLKDSDQFNINSVKPNQL